MSNVAWEESEERERDSREKCRLREGGGERGIGTDWSLRDILHHNYHVALIN